MFCEQIKSQPSLHRKYPVCKLCHIVPEARSAISKVAGRISEKVFAEIDKNRINTTKVMLLEALGEDSEDDMSGIISQEMNNLRDNPDIKQAIIGGRLTPQHLGQLLRYTPNAILRGIYENLCCYDSGHNPLYLLSASFNDSQGNGSTIVRKTPLYAVNRDSFC